VKFTLNFVRRKENQKVFSCVWEELLRIRCNMPPMQFSVYNYGLDLIGWLIAGDVHLSQMVAMFEKN
jgi:hypothetical protein